MTKIYTKTGDHGKTSLSGGTRLSKNAPEVNAYGTLDELNATIGLSIAEMELYPDRNYPHARLLCELQEELFVIEGIVATEPENWDIPKLTKISEEYICRLEKEIDNIQQELPAGFSFIMPRGSRLIALLHLNRTVCRRAERIVAELIPKNEQYLNILQYLNRLADFFFILSRFIHQYDQIPESNWKSIE